jgi:hypothetical protein
MALSLEEQKRTTLTINHLVFFVLLFVVFFLVVLRRNRTEPKPPRNHRPDRFSQQLTDQAVTTDSFLSGHLTDATIRSSSMASKVSLLRAKVRDLRQKVRFCRAKVCRLRRQSEVHTG